MSPVEDTGPARARLRPTLAGMLGTWHQPMALSFGLGLSPLAPGTFGSIGGFALFQALQQVDAPFRVAAYAILVVLASWAADLTGRDLNDKDHNAIVIDETLGMSLVLEFSPGTPAGLVAAFLLFRLFDIWKPWPVNLADECGKGGFFVILDDLLAAAWAAVACTLAWQIGFL